jgi:hypothetical protein
VLLCSPEGVQEEQQRQVCVCRLVPVVCQLLACLAALETPTTSAATTHAAAHSHMSRHGGPRAPSPVDTSCGKVIPDVDFPGANLPASGVATASIEECVALCQSTAACTAAVRVFRGVCWLKSVDVATVVPVARPGMNSFLVCDSTAPQATPPIQTPPPDPAPAAPPVLPQPATNTSCGAVIPDVDMPGDNLPGSGVDTAVIEDCVALCKSTDACTAAIRVFTGVCWLKALTLPLLCLCPGLASTHSSSVMTLLPCQQNLA